MTEPAASSPPHPSDSASGLAPLFVAIVVTEVLVIAALGWFGRYFS